MENTMGNQKQKEKSTKIDTIYIDLRKFFLDMP
jgi:hypothetical protein